MSHRYRLDPHIVTDKGVEVVSPLTGPGYKHMFTTWQRAT
jgi:hypothetical protein